MPVLNLKPTHKPVNDYYKALHEATKQMNLFHEGAIIPYFTNLLRACASRFALDWVIGPYCVKTDKRSGITNDPNNLDDETYILRLIKQVITVSLETVEIVKNLPSLEIIEQEDLS